MRSHLLMGQVVGRMPKPDHIFDRESEWAELIRFAGAPSEYARLGVIRGRWRQGKTFLLEALVKATGGFYFAATESVSAEALRQFGEALALHVGYRESSFAFRDWDHALGTLFESVTDGLIVIDEFPYLARAEPALPSLLQRDLDHDGVARRSGIAKVLLCGSAMSVMGRLLAGHAPLYGRASLDMVVQPFDYRTAARFWDIDDPRLAVLVHAIVGGTPAYRREFVNGDAPSGLDDFDPWVTRTVLNPARSLFHEPCHRLIEEEELRRERAPYHGVLAGIADGYTASGGIAKYLQCESAQVVHPLNVLEECGLIVKEPDAFRPGRARYRITEPLITFYEAAMRGMSTSSSRRATEGAWTWARPRFLSQVVGPHFEGLCREFAQRAELDTFGGLPSQVLAGTVPDPARRTQIEVDVVVLGTGEPGERRPVLSLGEAKWGTVMGMEHLNRLRRARDLLAAKGFEARDAVLACYSGAGFDAELREAAGRGDVLLVGLDQLYGV